MNRSQPLGMRTKLAVLLLAVVSPSSAWASGSLVISLQDDRSRAVEGTVTARPLAGGQSHTCSTRGGRCSIAGLAAGRHQVTAALVRGGFVPAATVTIVDGRSASVRLTAQAASAPATQTQTQQAPTSSGGTTQVPATTSGSTQPGTTPGTGVTVRPGGAVQGAPTAARPRQTVRGGLPVVVRPGTGTQPSGQSAPVAVGTTTATAQTAQVSTRDLGTGQHASVLGTTQDQRGRRVEGTVTVTQSGRTIGTVSTTGGSFTAFDLTAGTYSFSFRALTGEQTSRNVTVAGGPATSVRLSVTR